MRFIVGAIVTAGVLALVVAYQDFKKLQSAVGLRPYSLSLNCQQWYRPTQSFSDYLKIIQGRLFTKSPFEFLSLDIQGGSPVAYSAKSHTAVMKNGYIFHNSDYAVYQSYTDIQINKASLQTPYSLIFNKTSHHNSLLTIVKSKLGYQVAFQESTPPILCEVSKDQQKCSTGTWTKALDVSPLARNAIDVFCQNQNDQSKKHEALRTELHAWCESDFSFDQNLKLPCELFKGR